jgi:hypothetical protein
MSNDVEYLSGRVKKTPPSQVSADRYQWLKPNDVEPDLGIPPVNNAVAASLTSGTRKWLELSSGLKITSDVVTVDETTVPVDTTNFIYSSSSNLADVLADLDTNISAAVGGNLATVNHDSSLSGAGTVSSPLSVLKWATPVSISLTGDVSGTVSIDGSGNVSLETTITVTGGSASDLLTITKSLTLTTDWQDVGISGTNLTTGSYLIQLFANDVGAGGTNTNEYYTGTMSWYAGATGSSNELPTDEIPLHRAGAGGDGSLYLRTYRSSNGFLKLQIYANQPNTSASNYVFKFRRLI